MKISECNPFIRYAQIQPTIFEGEDFRMAYDYRLFYILEGTGKLLLEDRQIQLNENSLILFPYKTKYFFKGKMKSVVINFDLTRIMSHKKKSIFPPSKKNFDDKLITDHTKCDNIDKLIHLENAKFFLQPIMEIVQDYFCNNESSDASCSGQLKKILAKIELILINPTELSNNPLRDIILYIKSNANKIKNAADIGNHFNYHPVYLSYLIKKETGKTLISFINEAKIELAKKYLLTTNNSIEQIAFECGFSTSNYFCTVFKKSVGTSPLSFRNNYLL